MTPLTEEQYTDLKRFHTRVRLKWDATQAAVGRYPTSLSDAQRFFAREEMPTLDEGKALYLHLKSLAKWLHNMENYDWETAEGN